ncbi:isopentenyl transferase family protein, partial [Paramuribaculum intestinale]
MEKTLLVVTGPTASGKSALSLRLAKELSTEIISADSRQLYRDIPIATAAPSPQMLAEIRHHLVG